MVLDATSIDAAQAAALLRGIQAFSQQVAMIQATGPLAEVAAGLGQPLATIVSIGDELRRGLADPLASRLSGPLTLEQVEVAFRAAAADDGAANILGLSGIGHRTVAANGHETLWFEMTFSGSRSLPQYRLDLDQRPADEGAAPTLLDRGLALDPVDVDVAGGFSARVGFGIDLTPGLDADQATRIKFEPLRVSVSAGRTLDDLGASLGALRLGPTDARVDLSLAATIGSASAPAGVGFADDPGIPLARFAAAPASDLFVVAADPASRFDVTIPFTLSLGGFVESGRDLELGVTAADPFRGRGEPTALDLRPLALSPVGGGAIDASSLGRSRITDLVAYLDALRTIVPDLVGGIEIPVVEAEARTLFDLSADIGSIIDAMHFPDGTLRFDSLEGLVERLVATIPSVTAADIAPRWNAAARGIEFTLPISLALDTKAAIDPANIIPAALSSGLSITGGIGAAVSLKIGLKLTGGAVLPAETKQEVGELVYLAAAEVGTAILSLEVDARAGAALGPLALSIDGGHGLLAGGAKVAVSLADPGVGIGNGDGRITLHELAAHGMAPFLTHAVSAASLDGVFQLTVRASSDVATASLRDALAIHQDDYLPMSFAADAPHTPLANRPTETLVPFIKVTLAGVDGWIAEVGASTKLESLLSGFQDVSVADLPALLKLVPDFLHRAGLDDIPIPMTGATLGDLLGLADLAAGFHVPDLTLRLGDPATSSAGTGFSTPAFAADAWRDVKVPTVSFGLTGFDITPFFDAMLQRIRLDHPDQYPPLADVFGRWQRLSWEFDKLRADWSGRLPNADGTQGFADFDAAFLSKLRGFASAGALILGDLPDPSAHPDFDWNLVPQYVLFREGFGAICAGIGTLGGGFEDFGDLLAAGFPGLGTVSFTPVPETSLFDLSFKLADVRRSIDFSAIDLRGGIPLEVTGNGGVSLALGGTLSVRLGWDPVTHAPLLDAAASNVAIEAGIDDGGGVSLTATVGGLAGVALGWTDTASHPERHPARLMLTNAAGDKPALFKAGVTGLAAPSSARFVVDLPLYVDGVPSTGAIHGEGTLALAPTTFSFDIGHVHEGDVEGNPVTLPRILANVAVDFTGWLDGAKGFVDLLVHDLADDLLAKIPFLDGIDVGSIGFFTKLSTLFTASPGDLFPLDLSTPALFGPSLSARIGDLLPEGSVALRIEGPDGADRTAAIGGWSDLGAGDRVIVELTLRKSDTTTLAGDSIDLGIDGLGIGIRGEAALELATDFEINVGLGYSRTEGFFVQAVPNRDEISATIGLGFKEGGNCEIRLGVLYFDLVDRTPGTADPANRELEAGLHLNFPEGRTGLANLPGLVLDSTLSGEVRAGLDIGIRANLFGDGFGIETGLKLGFSRPDGSPIPLTSAIETLDLGDHFHFDGLSGLSIFFPSAFDDSSALGRLVGRLTRIVEPIRPYLAMLKEEIPVISDVSRKVVGQAVTYLDAIKASNGLSADQEALLDRFLALETVLTTLDFLRDGTYPLGTLALLEGISPRTLLAEQPATNDSFDPGGITPLPASITTSLAELERDLGLRFPILTDPFGQLFNLLFGREADIVTWHVPGADNLGFEIDRAFNIFGPLYVRLAGHAGFSSVLDVGIDTRGVRQAFGGSGASPLKLFNGIYFSDHVENGVDTPELFVSSGVKAGIGIGLPGFVEAEVDGGLEGLLTADLKDRTRDGKVYLDELAANLLRGPECVFDFGGRLRAFLVANVRVGVDTPFGFKTLFSDSYEFYDTTIADFEIITCPPAKPNLADVLTLDAANGFDTSLYAGIPTAADPAPKVLVLNVGTRAGEVVPGKTTDGDEEFTVEAKDGGILVKAYETEEFFSVEELAGVQWIIFDAGIGNDVITVAPEVMQKFWGYGGPGRDQLTIGSGGGRLFGDGGGAGGSANGDKLVGRGGIDELHGDDGDDLIIGYGAADLLFGDDGEDQLFGDDELGDWTTWTDAHPEYQTQLAGADEIRGGAGRDTITGSDGADTLFGDDDDDEIHGKAGGDRIEGGAGVDQIFGENDDDTIWGDDSSGTITVGSDTINADVIEGGFGFNVIHGGPGGDLIYAVSKFDGAELSPQPFAPYGFASQLSGDDGADTIYGTASADLIEGGFEGDALYSGDGADLVIGGPGNDLLVAAGGAARLFGGYGSDVIDGGDGDNWIEGGPGDDKLFGRGGTDTIYGGTTNAGYGYLLEDEASGRAIVDPIHGGFTALVRPDSCAPEIFHHPEVYPETPFAITITLFDDLDGDGSRSAGEPDAFSQSGPWSILLVPATAGSGVPTTTHQSGGGTTLIPGRGGLMAGAWSLLVTTWPGFEWQPVNDASLATATPLVLDGAHPTATVDLPYFRPGALAGTVSVGSALQHHPEANVRVYIDRDKDGLLGADEPTTLTDATGGYRFDARWTALPPGSYEVRVDLPPGPPSAPRVRQAALTSGATVSGLDFLIPESVTAVSAVLLGEGTASEEPRWTPVPDGAHQLDPIAPRVGFTRLAVEILSTAPLAAADFDAVGATLVRVGADGSDGAAIALAAPGVFATASGDGKRLAFTITPPAGSSSLPAGRYRLRLADTTVENGAGKLDGEWLNPSGTSPGGTRFASGNGSAGGTFVFDFVVAAVATGGGTGQDAPPAAAVVEGAMWMQVYAAGATDGHDAAEPVLPGQTVRAYDEAGNVVAETVTGPIDLDGDGRIVGAERAAYRFTSLPAGHYRVATDPAGGWSPATIDRKILAATYYAVGHVSASDTDMATNRLSTIDPVTSKATEIGVFSGLVARDVASPTHSTAYVTGTATIDFGVIPAGSGGLWSVGTAYPSAMALTPTPGGVPLLAFDTLDAGTLVGVGGTGELYTYSLLTHRWTALGPLVSADRRHFRPVGDIAVVAPDEIYAVVVEAPADPESRLDLVQPGLQRLVRIDATALGANTTIVRELSADGITELVVGLETDGDRLLALSRLEKLFSIDPAAASHPVGRVVAGLADFAFGGLSLAPAELVSAYVPGGTDHAPETWIDVPAGGSTVVVDLPVWPSGRTLPDGDDTIDGGCGDFGDVLFGDDGDLPANVRSVGGSDTIRGRGGADTIDGGLEGDVILGDGGAAGDDRGDTIVGGRGGFNWIEGGDGGDTITGGPANDIVHGDAGDDDILGGDGSDMLFGGLGGDRLEGGLGADVLVPGAGEGARGESAFGGEGDDTLFVIDTAIGGEFGSTPSGGDGDIYDGGVGSDSLVVDTSTRDAAHDLPSLTLTNTKLAAFGVDKAFAIEFGLISGGAGNNAFSAATFDGRVVIRGNAGDDTLTGGRSDDLLDAGTGADNRLTGGLGNDRYLVAAASGTRIVEAHGEGTDTLDLAGIAAGGFAARVSAGFAGTEISSASPAVIVRFANDGLDAVLLGAGPDSVTLEDAATTTVRWEAGGGTDWLRYTDIDGGWGAWTGGVAVDLTLGTATGTAGVAGFENVLGGKGDDLLFGDAAGNRLDGGAGFDTLEGRGADDTLIGGPGDDICRGGTGDDTLRGDSGSNDLDGGGGDDSYEFFDSGSTDTVREAANAGTDRMLFAPGAKGVSFEIGAQIVAAFGTNRVTAITAAAIDLVRGGPAADVFRIADGVAFAGRLDGGGITGAGFADLDTLDYSLWTSPLTVDYSQLVDPATPRAVTGVGSVVNLRHVIGGAKEDTLSGGSDPVWFQGGDGRDTLTGSSDSDKLEGDSGADTIRGGAGADLIRGGTGDDDLVGGPGNDTFGFADAFGIDTVGEVLGGGSDVMDFSGVTAALTVELGSVSAFTAAGDRATHAGGEIERVRGGSADDLFVMTGPAVVFAGTLDGAGGVNELSWRNPTRAIAAAVEAGATPNVGGALAFAKFTADSNLHAPVFSSGFTGAVHENAPVTTVVYTARATDADPAPDDKITWSLEPGLPDDAAAVSIDTTSGEVRLLAPANFEVKNAYRFTVVATDAGLPAKSTRSQITINVLNVAEPRTAPRIAAPTGFATDEDTLLGLQFPGTPFTDADSPAATIMTVTLAIPDGSIAAQPAGGVAVAGTPTSRRFTGTLASLNAYFTTDPARVTYTPAANANGVRQLVVTISERSGAQTLSSTVRVPVAIRPVNDAPLLKVPAGFTFREDTPGNLAWTGLAAVSDVDSPQVTVRLSVDAGTLAANPTAAVAVAGTSLSRTFTGTPAAVSAYFATLGRIRFTAPADDTARRTLTCEASDGTDGVSANVRITVLPVNDPPTIAAALTLTGARRDTPLEIGHDLLLARSGAVDVDSAKIFFRIERILSGALQKWDGVAWRNVSVAAAAAAAQRRLDPGQRLRWIPPSNASGVRPAFTVRAWDGVAYSAVTATVSVEIGAAAPS